MAMTDTQRILAYLRSVSPRAATSSEILDGTSTERGTHGRTYVIRRANTPPDPKA